MQKNFTEEGQKMFNNLLIDLIKVYYNNEFFPVKLELIQGMPYSETGLERIISNKDELRGRINALMCLLGLEKIEFDYDSNVLMYKLGEEKNGS